MESIFWDLQGIHLKKLKISELYGTPGVFVGNSFLLLLGKMSDDLLDMKAVGTRELQHETRSIRERVQGGESFLWKDRGKLVAIISPASAQREPKPWPNLRKRLADAREKAKRGAPSASAAPRS